MEAYKAFKAKYDLAVAAFTENPTDSTFEQVEKLMILKETYDKWIVDANRQLFITEYKREVLKCRTNEPTAIAVTICPLQSDSHLILYDILQIIETIKPILSYRAVLEQRSEGAEPERGWHLHLSVISTYTPSKIKQFIEQKLKTRNLTAFIVAKKQYNKDWEDNYMGGNKYCIEKNRKVVKDLELREKYNIPLIIENGRIPST